jgi:hypothetical protein
MQTPTNSTHSKVVSLANYKAKKSTENDLARNRRPLYVSHLKGTASSDKNGQADLGDRISRIKSSLDRINNLMKDLKSMSDKK